jgi:hypothetical protein
MINFSELKIDEDYVVSLTQMNTSRYEGSIFKVLPRTNKNAVYYRDDKNSSKNQDFRMATAEEITWHLKDPRTNVNVRTMPKINNAYLIY